MYPVLLNFKFKPLLSAGLTRKIPIKHVDVYNCETTKREHVQWIAMLFARQWIPPSNYIFNQLFTSPSCRPFFGPNEMITLEKQ